MPFADIGLVKIEVSSSLKITESSLVLTENIKSLPSNTSSIPEELNSLVRLVEDYLQGRVEPEQILPYLELPDGLRGLALLTVLAIPRGKVASYSQIAEVIRTHPRVVGRFMAENKLPLIIPCHRVVQSSGGLGGYTCGVDVKRRILELEGVHISPSGKVDRKYFVNTSELRSRFLRLYEVYQRVRRVEET